MEKKRVRSSNYPSINLAEAVSLVEVIAKKLDISSSYDRETIAVAIGHTGVSGASASKIAALKYYGLLTGHGDLSLTELAKDIVTPTDAGARIRAIKTALSSPKLFSQLLEGQYKDASDDLLVNILVRKFGISQKACKQVLGRYRASVEFAETLGGEVVQKTNTPTEIDQNATSDDQPGSSSVQGKHGIFEIVVAGEVVMQFPDKYQKQLWSGEFGEAIEKLEKTINSYADRSVEEDTE